MLSLARPHNLSRPLVDSRSWNGVGVHSIRQEVLPGEAWHELTSDTAVLSVILAEAGGRCETRSRIAAAEPGVDDRSVGGHVSLIPAGHQIWGYSPGMMRAHEARFILDDDSVRRVLGDNYPSDLLTRPRLMFFDKQLHGLAGMLAAECDGPLGTPLYGDGLVSALLARLAGIGDFARRPAKGPLLTARQLGLVEEYISENLVEPIRLAELAALVDLSQSQFGRAFKATTGMTPHRWHLCARVAAAKSMMADPRQSLVAVALDTGFSEQSHFNRIFRAFTGMSPGAWRKTKLS